MAAVLLGRDELTFGDVVAVARDGARVELAPEARERMLRSRAFVDEVVARDRNVYGITTGVGALATTHIPPEAAVELQYALLRSHGAGMGPPVAREAVRAMMLCRANILAKGYCGARPAVAEALLALLNAGITPFVPRYGSLGASGDLAPLAHVALCLVGEGWVLGDTGERVEAAAALREAGIEPLGLQAKEGLALLNGTDGMLGMLVLACVDALALFRTADIAAALSVEALLGTDRPFTPDLQALRPQPGQAKSAANVMRMLADSPIVASHRESQHAVQDAYSLRCHPQVAGAARDVLEFAIQVATRELTAAIDNPVVLPDGRVESNGNFHGEPLAFAADFLAIAAAEVASIAERRIDRLLDDQRSRGLPAFLTPEPGVNSGLMVAQYTAAALVAENRRLSFPSSVESIPTSGMQEDHVSMGWNAAAKLRQVLDNTGRVVAIEAMCAAHGLDLRAPLAPAVTTGVVQNVIRARIPGPGPDRYLAPDLAAAEALVRSGTLLAAAEGVTGPLE
ncbi:MAG: histidine ammonia-lyase [Chloroflexi bacterium]|nr:histidine ammonia-lyase [Chloroflexota bacterium]